MSADLSHRTGLSTRSLATVLAVLARFPEVESATLYGSRAKGNFKPGSDIDLTLHGEGITHTTLVRLAGAFDDSDLPYTVDLSRFDTLENEALREHITRVGLVIYRQGDTGKRP